MKVFLALLVGAGAAAAPLTMLKPTSPTTADQAILEELRWMAAAEWHRQNPKAHDDACDFSACVRRHMTDHAKAVAEWNSPEGKKRREEDRAKWDADRNARKDQMHAEHFKHSRKEDCDLSRTCRDRESKWVEQKLIEEREK